MRAFPVRAVAAVCALMLASACAESPPQDSSGDDERGRSIPAETSPGSSESVPAETPAGSVGATGGVPTLVATEQALVTRVVDGDTAQVRIAGSGAAEKVRFIGINTPESTTRHEPYGSEASAFAKSRLDGRTIYLEYDADRRDRYGRLLAYIWMRPPADGGAADVRSGMFNATLLTEGYAQVATYPPNVRYVDVFRVLEREARVANRGLWALPG